MSGARALAEVKYRGATGFMYGEGERYLGRVERATGRSSIFYSVIRLFSVMVVIAFVTLLVSSMIMGGPVHWAVAVAGCLGSIGFAGTVWLSKSYVERNNM